MTAPIPTAPVAPVTEAHELRDLVSKLLHRNEPITASKAIQAAFDRISAAATAKALERAATIAENHFQSVSGPNHSYTFDGKGIALNIRALINNSVIYPPVASHNHPEVRHKEGCVSPSVLNSSGEPDGE